MAAPTHRMPTSFSSTSSPEPPLPADGRDLLEFLPVRDRVRRPSLTPVFSKRPPDQLREGRQGLDLPAEVLYRSLLAPMWERMPTGWGLSSLSGGRPLPSNEEVDRFKGFPECAEPGSCDLA